MSVYGTQLERFIIDAAKDKPNCTVNDIVLYIHKNTSGRLCQEAPASNFNLKRRIYTGAKRLEALGLLAIVYEKHPVKNNLIYTICLEQKEGLV